MMAKNRTGGAANSFNNSFLKANLVGTNVNGSKVTDVTNKYVYTENGAIEKKGLQVSFEIKEGTRLLISCDNSGDTEGDNI